MAAGLNWEVAMRPNRTYIEEGVQLLRLADRAHALFERQEPAEKRRLLKFLLSNCVWKDGVLTAEYRQPFDMLALAREAAGDQVGESATETASCEKWLNPRLTNCNSREIASSCKQVR